MKRMFALFCTILLLPVFWGHAKAVSKQAAITLSRAEGGLSYSFSLPGTEFACLQYKNGDEQGMLTLRSSDGRFEGVLPLSYTQTARQVMVTVLSIGQKQLLRQTVDWVPSGAPETVKAGKDAVRKVTDLELTPGEKEMGYRFTAPGHPAVVLNFSSVMQKGAFVITADEAGVFAGTLSLPNAYARDLITLRVRDLRGRELAEKAERTLFVPPEAGVTAAAGPLSGVVVCLDPGHQQADVRTSKVPVMPGSDLRVFTDNGGMAQGAVTLRKESVAALEISYRACAALREAGALVFMTRWNEETGVSNLGRADYAHEVGADYFIRVHLNMAEKRTANAIDVYCPDKSPYACLALDKATYRLLARALADALSAQTGVKTARTHFSDQFIGNNWARMPAFLVETGYMSSPANDVLLSHPVYQDRVARGIAEGVIAMEEVLKGAPAQE